MIRQCGKDAERFTIYMQERGPATKVRTGEDEGRRQMSIRKERRETNDEPKARPDHLSSLADRPAIALVCVERGQDEFSQADEELVAASR